MTSDTAGFLCDFCRLELPNDVRLAEHRENVHGVDPNAKPDKCLCARCKREPKLEQGIYCQACSDHYAAHEQQEKRRQWDSIRTSSPRMHDWTLATFPADDNAGRAALEAVSPWLWVHTGHRLVDGALIPISEENPEPDIAHEDHPMWEWFFSDQLDLNLYLWGPVGSGKTGLAWSLLRARVELKYDWEERRDEYPAWANVVQLLDKAKAAMSAGEPASPIRDLYDASMLVLDDLGAERPTDWARDAIAALVQHRHERELPTIVTSNYAPSALAKRLGHDDPIIGQRIVSRLTERCIKHKLDRADLRLRRAA